MSPTTRRGRAAIDALGTLSEPTRGRVYDAVRRARAPLTRDEVAKDVGIGRPIAAFHLDALAKAGLLEVDFARPAGRSGPGAGRPAKRYRAAPADIAANVPERRYDLAGQILAAGVRDAGESGNPRAATFAAAREKGHELAAGYREVPAPKGQLMHACKVLSDLGYEPIGQDADLVRLRNCPFHAVVDVEPQLVCEMNLHLVEGLLEGLELDQTKARFAPTPGECCVHIAARALTDRHSRHD
jgi:predicted ArsR family transcriptional regulator